MKTYRDREVYWFTTVGLRETFLLKHGKEISDIPGVFVWVTDISY